MFRIICLLIGYLIGCFQTAYLAGKFFGKIDIREHGSGNAGTTNVTRVLGRRAGLLVFVCDILKGVISVILCSLIFSGSGTFTGGAVEIGVLPALYGGLGAVLGHDFPVYLKFKGGKGIATSLGVILCINPVIAILTYISGCITLSATKYMSLASLIVLASFPVMLALFSYKHEAIFLGVAMAVLAYYQHRGNIQRLLAGNERKFSFKRKVDVK